MVAGCCYKLLENPALNREKELRDTILHLLGVLASKYCLVLSMSLP